MAETVPYWHAVPRGSVHGALVETVDRLRHDYQQRRERYKKNLSIYEGCTIGALNAEGYQRIGPTTPQDPDAESGVRYRVARSAILSVQAKISGRDRPVPAFLTDGANWTQRRSAKRLERFAEAMLSQRQGMYDDGWELAGEVLNDAAVLGTGVIKIYADTARKKIVLERTPAWEILVDPEEGRAGTPRNLFHTYSYDKHELAARFPKHATAIMRSEEWTKTEPEYTSTMSKIARRTRVIEAWYLPYGDKPGRHVISVSETALVDEPWKRSEFPFAFIRWNREKVGFWGRSLIDDVGDVEMSLNRSVDHIEEAIEHTALNITWVRRGTVDDETLQSNEIGTIAEYDGESPPVTQTPPPISPQIVQHVENQFAKVYEISGVSQASAASRKSRGVTSGIAIQTESNIETERFSVVAQRYEGLIVRVAGLAIASTRELASVEPDFSMRWPGSKFLRSIKWADISLDESMYEIQPRAQSILPRTPSGRMQIIEQLIAAQLIPPQAAPRLIKDRDLDAYFRREDAQFDLIEMQVDEMLDAREEDDDEFEPPRPDGYIPDLDRALMQVGYAYLEAATEKAPEYNLQLLRDWLRAGEALIERRDSAAQEAQAQAAPAEPPMAADPMADPMAAADPMAGAGGEITPEMLAEMQAQMGAQGMPVEMMQ